HQRNLQYAGDDRVPRIAALHGDSIGISRRARVHPGCLVLLCVPLICVIMILAGSEIVRSLSFSVNHYLCPACTGIETFLDEARNYGFQAVGLTEAALQSLPISDLRAELEARGLGVSSINSAGFFLYEGDAAR